MKGEKGGERMERTEGMERRDMLGAKGRVTGIEEIAGWREGEDMGIMKGELRERCKEEGRYI